jgi:pilus assembly protein Flp/PilA
MESEMAIQSAKEHLRLDERGQTLVEYALILALVAIALLGTLQAFGGGVGGLYGTIQAAVDALT